MDRADEGQDAIADLEGPHGFAWRVRKDGSVDVAHHGISVATLRGRLAERFLADVDAGRDPQRLLARLTGNYRRGNERQAGQHRRNR